MVGVADGGEYLADQQIHRILELHRRTEKLRRCDIVQREADAVYFERGEVDVRRGCERFTGFLSVFS